MLRVVWLDIASSYSHPSTVLPLLHSAANRDMLHGWHVVRGVTTDSPSLLTAAVAALQPDILAASLYLFNRQTTLAVLHRVKQVLSQCTIAVGGPECLGAHEDLLAPETGIDAVFRGEGEASFPSWLQCVVAGTPWDRIPGVSFRTTDGTVHDNGLPGSLSPGFGSSPWPCEDPFFIADRAFVNLETSRGCPFSCTFCTSRQTQPVRTVAVTSVRHQLHLLRDRGVSEIRLLDRTFNLEQERCLELLALFRNEFPDLRFHLEILPEGLTPQMRGALAEAPAGQLHVEAGLQTLSPDARRAVQRYGSPEQALEGVRFLCECRNLAVHVDLLAGLPCQSWQQVLDDVNTLILAGPEEIQLETLKILPGTVLRSQAVDLGIRFSRLPPYEVLQTETMDTGDLLRGHLLSKLIDRFRNPDPVRNAFRQALSVSPSLTEDFLRELQYDGTLDHPVSPRRSLELLHAFLAPDTRQKDALDLLEMNWLLAGLSPAHALADTDIWRGDIPAEASLVSGVQPKDSTAHLRIWHMTGRRYDYWAIYGKGSPREGPSTLYRRPREI